MVEYKYKCKVKYLQIFYEFLNINSRSTKSYWVPKIHIECSRFAPDGWGECGKEREIRVRW